MLEYRCNKKVYPKGSAKAAAVALFVFLLIATSWAQDLGLDQLDCQQRNNFEVYLDHADQAQTQDDWMRIAQFGVQTVVGLWETAAAQLADKGIDLPGERARMEGDLSTMLQEHLSRWLIEKAFADNTAAQSAGLARAVLVANLEKLYVTDQDGIQYDSSGDPVMYQSDNLDADKADWSSIVTQALQDQLASWDEHAAAIRTELLTHVTDGTAFEGQFTATEAQYRASYQRELDTEFQREQSRFLNARMRDQLSLRKKSESTTAASVVAQIISSANAEVSAGIQALKDSLSTEHAATPGGEISIDPAVWQDSFRREFDKGMVRWSKAEQDLLVQRAQWEKSVSDQFQSGEQEWADAYQQLQDARTQWESQLRDVLDTGRAQWESKQSDLTAAIDQARSQLSQSIEERTQSLDTKITAMTGLANQAANILRTAQSSLDYWTDPSKNDQNNGDVQAQITFWTKTQTTYSDYYRESLQFLADTAVEINGGAPGTLSYTDIFGTDTIDTRALDDYQVALLGARATQAYWQKQVDIATAVAAYAHDTSSSRDTAAVTEQKYQQAIAAFKARQDAYTAALQQLEQFAGDVQASQQHLSDLQDQLEQLDGQLKAARQQYQDVVDMYSTSNDAFFRQQLQGYYQDLYEKSGLSTASDHAKTETQAYADYIAALNAQGLESEVYGAANAVNQLVQGNASAMQPSLQDLSDTAARARAWSFDASSKSTFLDSLTSLGIRGDDSATAVLANQLSTLFDAYSKIGASADDAALARLQIVGLMNQFAAQKQGDLSKRLAEISLLTSPKLSDWAAAVGITVASGADTAAVRSVVEQTAGGSSAQAFLEEAQAEKAILAKVTAQAGSALATFSGSMILSDLPGATQDLLAALFAGKTGTAAVSEATRRVNVLQSIIDSMTAILSSVDARLTSHSGEMRDLAQSSDLARSFLSGSSMFMFDGVDYGRPLLVDASEKAELSRALAQYLTTDAHTAPVLVAALGTEATSRLQALLRQRGIATAVSADTVTFRGAADVFDDVWSAANGDPSKVVTWLEGVQTDVAALAVDLPQPVIDQAQTLLQSLSEVFALRLDGLGKSPGSSTTTRTAVNDLTDRMQLVEQDLSRIQGRTVGAESDTAALLAALRSIQSLQSAGDFDSSSTLGVSLSASDVSALFISEAAVSIARDLCAGTGAVDASTAAIDAAVSQYLGSSTLRSLVADPVISPLMGGITASLTAATRSVLQRVLALSDPAHTDWSAVSASLRSEYAESVWNTHPLEWFTGSNDSNGHDVLTTTDATSLEVLHSIYVSLTGSWGTSGVSESSWNGYLQATYYAGSVSSFFFDQGLAQFESALDAGAAAGTAYTGISRSFLGSWTPSASVISAYGYASGLKTAIDQVIDGKVYSESAAQAAIDSYAAAHPGAASSQLTAFATSYLALYRGSTGAVDVSALKGSWLRLLRNQLGGATLSSLSTTTAFTGVAAVDLLGSVAGSLIDNGFTIADFATLKGALVDENLSGDEAALLGGIGSYADCQVALDSYLSKLSVSAPAIADDDADRGFGLAVLYAQGYLGAESASAQASFRQSFRGQYLSGNLVALGAALSYADDLRTLGSASKDAWFASRALSSAGLERAAAINDTDLRGRSGIDANERSLALGINYDLSQMSIDESSRIALTGWMLSVAGAQAPAHIDTIIQQADGATQGTPPATDALFLLLGCPEAALWILKRKTLAGKSIAEYDSEVDPTVWAQAQAFDAQNALRNRYVATAETGALQYGAQATGGTFSTALSAAALAATGVWSDPVFDSAPGTDRTDILSADRMVQSSRARILLDATTVLLSTQIASMSQRQQALGAKLIIQKQYEQIAGGLEGSALAYRAYLNTSLMKLTGSTAPADASQHLARDSGGSTDAVDTASGINYVAPTSAATGTAGPLLDNALLEAANDFASQADQFNVTIQGVASMNRDLLSSFYSAFSDIQYSAATGDAFAVAATWSANGDALGFVPTGATRAAASTARETLAGFQAQMSSEKEQIASLGTALTLYLKSTQANVAAATSGLQKNIDKLSQQRDALNTQYENALNGFQTANATYSELYEGAKDASRQLENARFELQKAEAIETFASTGYLNVDTGAVQTDASISGDQSSVSLGVDPDQRLAAAQTGLLRARAAFDALQSLYSAGSQPADFANGNDPAQVAYLSAFKEFQKQYGGYLAMERLSSLLSSGVATQQKAVADAKTALERDSIAKMLNVAPTSMDYKDESDSDGDSDSKSHNIKRFVQVKLSESGIAEFTYGTESSTDQQNALTDYMTGTGAKNYSTDREQWVSELSTYLQSHDATQTISDWGMALQHEMGILMQGKDEDKPYTSTFSSYYVEASTASSGSQGGSSLSGDDAVSLDGYAGTETDTYSRVMADPTERKLFQFFVAMNMLGQVATKTIDIGTITAKYEADAKQYLIDLLEPKQQAHYNLHQADMVVGAVLAQLGFMFSNLITWPIALAYYACAGLVFYEAAEQNNAQSLIQTYQNNLQTDADGLLNGDSQGDKGVKTEISDLLGATTGSNGYLSLSSNLDAQQATLDKMLGTTDGAVITTDSVVSALATAAASKNVNLSDILALANKGADASQQVDLKGLISRFIESATTGDHPAADAATAVNDMLYEAQTQRDDAYRNLSRGAADLASAQSSREAAYQQVVRDLAQIPLPDPSHPSAAYEAAAQKVQAAAQAAYGAPLYCGINHYNRLIATESSYDKLVSPSVDPSLNQAQQDLFSAQKRDLEALWEERSRNYMAAQENSWAVMQQDLVAQQSQWQSSMQAIMKRAESQWDDALRALQDEHSQWQSAFQSAYEDRAATWDASYAKLETNKAGWVSDAASKAASVGSQAVLSQLGQSAESGVRDAMTITVTDLGIAKPDARSVVAGIMQGKDFASLIKGGQILNRGIGSVGVQIFAQLSPDIFQTANVLKRVAELSGQSTEEIDKHVLLITANEAREAVEKAASQMNDQIGDANASVAEGLNRTMVEAGFVRKGDHYERETVVDSDVSGPLTETHIVPSYAAYVPDAPIASRVDLSDAQLMKLSSTGIQGMVDLAIKDMQGQVEKIFGKSGDKGSANVTTWTTLEHQPHQVQQAVEVGSREHHHTEMQTFTVYTDDRVEAAGAKEMGAGEFGKHVGAAPELDCDNADATAGESEYSKYLKNSGSGQMAAVITPFLWSQMKEGMGWAMVKQPLYDQKLWDDRGSWVKAPSIRTVADVGVAVLGAVIPGGAIVSTALSLTEKGLFTVADVANGKMTWDEGLFSMAKSAASSLLTMGMGELGRTVGEGLKALQGTSGLIAQTMWSGAQGLMSNMGQGLINSVTYRSDGPEAGFGFDGNALTQAVMGQQALYGYLGGMTQTAVTGGLNMALGGGEQGFWKGGVNLAASAASMGVEYGVSYAMTAASNPNMSASDRAAAALDGMGGIDLNLLDVGALYGMMSGGASGSGGNYEAEVQRQQMIQQLTGMGLLDLHIGSKGASVSLGTGGASVMGNLYQLNAGLETRNWAQQEGAKLATSNTSAQDIYQMIGYNYSYGNSGSLATIARLMSETDNLHIGFSGDLSSRVNGFDPTKADAVTVANSAGNRDIYLGSVTSGVLGAVTLAHESQRNGVLDPNGAQQSETIASVLAHTLMAVAITGANGGDAFAGQTQIQGEMAIYNKYGAAGLAQYTTHAYDSSADYWRLTKDGNLAYDGKANVYDEYGNLIRKTQSQGIEGSLLEILGLPDTTENRDVVVSMMKASGLEQDTKGLWVGDATSVARTVTLGIDVSEYIVEGVNLTTSNMGKEISLSSVDKLYRNLGVGASTYRRFIENNYVSAMGFLSSTALQKGLSWRTDLYQHAYTETERQMIQTNISFVQSVQEQGINYDVVAPNTAQTTGFDESVFATLSTSAVPGAAFLLEDHTGVDRGSGGTGVYTPGGFWTVLLPDDNKLYLQLFGTDVRMRIQHLDPSKVAELEKDSIIGQANGSAKIIDYPTQSFGSGTNPHTHIDFTRSLVDSGAYTRYFVSPYNWAAGNHLNYEYSYYDSNKALMNGYPMNFSRY